jgi:hypothetical protein
VLDLRGNDILHAGLRNWDLSRYARATRRCAVRTHCSPGPKLDALRGGHNDPMLLAATRNAIIAIILSPPAPIFANR